MGIGSKAAALKLNSAKHCPEAVFYFRTARLQFESDPSGCAGQSFQLQHQSLGGVVGLEHHGSGVDFETTHRDRAITQLQNCFLV